MSVSTVAVLTGSTLPALSAEKYATVCAPSTAGTLTSVPAVHAPPSSEYSVVLIPEPPRSIAVRWTATAPLWKPLGASSFVTGFVLSTPLAVTADEIVELPARSIVVTRRS